MPSGSITVLNEKVLALLAPLVVSESIKTLEVQHFGTVNDIGELLEKFKGRMPGAYFCPASIVFKSAQGSGGAIRATDASFTYLLLAALPSRRNPTERHDSVWLLVDEICSRLNLASLTAAGLKVLSPVDFVRLTRVDYLDAEQVTAFLIGFEIGLRNWNP